MPSPVAGSLLYDMIAQYMYEWDQPKAERQMQALMVGRELLSQLLDDASGEARCPTCCVQRRCATWTPACSTWPTAAGPARPRSWPPSFWPWATCRPGRRPPAATATARPGSRTWPPMAAWLPLDLAGDRRYVLPEQADAYRAAFGPAVAREAWLTNARRAILRRVLSTHGPLTRDWLLARYPWPPEWLDAALEALVENGEVVTGQITPRVRPVPNCRTVATKLKQSEPDPRSPEYCDRRNLERIHRQTLALLRKEVEPVSIYAYADFLARWQHLHPAERLSGPGGLVRLLQQMRGVPAPGRRLGAGPAAPAPGCL